MTLKHFDTTLHSARADSKGWTQGDFQLSITHPHLNPQEEQDLMARVTTVLSATRTGSNELERAPKHFAIGTLAGRPAVATVWDTYSITSEDSKRTQLHLRTSHDIFQHNPYGPPDGIIEIVSDLTGEIVPVAKHRRTTVVGANDTVYQARRAPEGMTQELVIPRTSIRRFSGDLKLTETYARETAAALRNVPLLFSRDDGIDGFLAAVEASEEFSPDELKAVRERLRDNEPSYGKLTRTYTPLEQAVLTLRDQPFLGSTGAFTSPKDGAFGITFDRDCGMCYFRGDEDCQLASRKSHAYFGVEELPSELDGVRTGNYCPFWTDFDAE